MDARFGVCGKITNIDEMKPSKFQKGYLDGFLLKQKYLGR